MPWTESRTRDEWLAEVRRRGERLRRRRRVAVSGAGALALIVPLMALATMTGGDPDPDLRVTAAGPGPAREGVGGSLPPVVETTVLEAQPPGPTIVPGGSGTEPGYAPDEPSPPSTTEVHRRASSVNGRQVDEPPGSGPPTTAAGRADDNVSSGPLQPLPPNAAPPPTDPSVTTCPVDQVEVTVTMGQSEPYRRGQRVTWSSTITNASGRTCLMSGRAFFHVEDSVGNKVGQFAYTADFQMPVKAEPGKSITNSHSWDQKDCSRNPCAPVPPGRYTVVAAWTEAARYVGYGAFDIEG